MAKKDKKTEKELLRVRLIDRFSTLIISAFGLVAALAWNSAIQSIFETYAPGDGINHKVVYAILVTILAFFVTYWIGSFVSKKE